MTLTINSTCDLITVSSTLLDDFITDPSAYTDIKVIGTYLSNDGITKTYTQLIPITSSTDVATNADIETIKPSFFDATVFSSGIYSFEIVLRSNSEVESDDGCIFIDCIPTDDCIGSMLKSIYDLDLTDSNRIEMLLDYNLLTRINDCQCKCDKALVIYNYLNNKITDKCKTC